MEEAISRGLSNLLPLLGLLAAVGGGLIALAVVLRYRLRHNAKPAVSVTSASRAAKGDLVSVLGRTYTVENAWYKDGEEAQFVWICLLSDEASARLAFLEAGGLAVSFPGKAKPVEERGFPQTLSMDGKEYKKNMEQHLEGFDLALYTGDLGFWLALEEQGGVPVAWRGKEIPAEGVTVLQD